MLTARDQSRDRVRGLDTGADDYVVKPFDLPELFARLRALIRRSANKTTNVIEIGDVKIDTAARNVFFKDKTVELTAREYALVEFLALHRGEVVTRTTLYEHLFDENDSTLSNLLDVHVSNVRKNSARNSSPPAAATAIASNEADLEIGPQSRPPPDFRLPSQFAACSTTATPTHFTTLSGHATATNSRAPPI